MNIVVKKEFGSLTLSPEGRLDTNTVSQLEKELKLGENVKELVFDFDKLDYISSAGLRVLLSAQKTMKKNGGSMRVINASRDICDIFDVTGFSSILDIRKKLKEISLEGCELIARGTCGECWRIDDETVAKVYLENMPDEWIDMEKAYSKAAFILGIPTAISYDIVSVGKRKGVVYEMIKAKTLASVIAADPDNTEHYAKMFAELGKTVHATQGDPKIFNRRLDYYRALLPRIDWLDEGETKTLMAILDSIPDVLNCNHGDFHPNNVMYQDGQLIFIDMGDFSLGDPMMDISLTYNIYTREYTTDLAYSITKLDSAGRHRFWKYFFDYYFDFPSPEESERIERRIRMFAAVRQIAYILEFEDTRADNIAFMKQVLHETAERGI